LFARFQKLRVSGWTLGTIEIELKLTATSDVDANGKIKFEVLGIGADIGGTGSISREHVQKVKFTLSPHFSAQFGGGNIHIHNFPRSDLMNPRGSGEHPA
jgi:hypothetical protein